MIDYDLTIQKFFDTAIECLKKRKNKSVDKDELARIQQTLDYLRVAKANPADYSDFYKKRNDDMLRGFMKYTQGIVDNSEYIAFTKVLNAIKEMNDSPDWDEKKQNLLQAIKRFNYTISTSVLRDFVYPFRSVKSFAVNTDKIK